MPIDKRNKNLGGQSPRPTSSDGTEQQPGNSCLRDGPKFMSPEGLSNKNANMERSVRLEPSKKTCDHLAEEKSRSELNMESISSPNTKKKMLEKEVGVKFLNPVSFKPNLESYKASWTSNRLCSKLEDPKILGATTLEEIKKRYDEEEKLVIIGNICHEVIETALVNTNDAIVDSIINDILECAFQNSSEGIATDIVNEIINKLPDEQEVYSAEYYDSGRISQVLVDGSTIRRRSFLPYMPLTSKANFIKMFKQLFLPHGFPETVSSDYAEYQVWDSLQAFFSTLTGALTTHSVMKGVGVGDAKATAVSAAITWLLRDGTGLVGRIAFAYWKGTEFDMNCKKWRFFADILNDMAMFFECLIPVVTPSRPLFLLCLSTIMKSLVGVAGGATRAAITHHQAIRGNMADVSAKDQSQESCVNLIASFIGIFILMTIADSSFKWDMFIFFVLCHLACNYRAVKAVQLATLNTARFILILRCYVVLKSVGSVKAINRNESVILGKGLGVSGLCGYNINLGASLLEIQLPNTKFMQLSQYYANYSYMLYVDDAEDSIQVFLKETATPTDIIQAFYHATLLALGTSIKNNQDLLVLSREVERKDTPIQCLADIILDSRMQHNHADVVMDAAGKIVQREFPAFLKDLQRNGWETEHLLFDVAEWRATV